MGLKKCIYSTYSPWAPHTYDFVVLTSLTHTRRILLVVLQTGKAKDSSAPLHVDQVNIKDVLRIKLSITCCLWIEKLLSHTALYCLILQAGKPSKYLTAFEPHWWWQPEYILAQCKLTEKLSLLCHLLEKNQTKWSIMLSTTAVSTHWLVRSLEAPHKSYMERSVTAEQAT
jgi:hypothetical protein